MKKTMSLRAPNKTPERQCDSIKYEIRKYITRERKKALPEGVDFWGFDCRIGATEASAQAIHVAEINKKIDVLFNEGKESFYMEILAKPAVRRKKSEELK